MALDLTILGGDGQPVRYVPLGVDEHYALMKLVESQESFLLNRLVDYYEDAEFQPHEIKKLIEETEWLEGPAGDENLRRKIRELRELLFQTLKSGVAVCALPD